MDSEDKEGSTGTSSTSPPPSKIKSTPKPTEVIKKLPAGKVKLAAAIPKKAIAIGAGASKKKGGFTGLKPKVATAPVEKPKAGKGKKVEGKVAEKKKVVPAAVVKPDSDDEEGSEEEVAEDNKAEAEAESDGE